MMDWKAWRPKYERPFAPTGYVSMQDAGERIGKARYVAEWTGREFYHGWPDAAAPEWETLAERRASVVDVIHTAAEAGQLEFDGWTPGKMHKLPAVVWNCSRSTAERRIALCSIEPLDVMECAPLGYFPAALRWPLLVGKSSLDSFVESLAAGRVAPLVQSRAAAVTECRQWLERIFQEPETCAWVRADFWGKARETFAGRLSERGFLIAWADTAPACGRSKSGPKKPRA